MAIPKAKFIGTDIGDQWSRWVFDGIPPAP